MYEEQFKTLPFFLSIKWFESYLSDQQQEVSANGTESDFLNIN